VKIVIEQMDRNHEVSQYAHSRSQAAVQSKPVPTDSMTDADFKSYVLYVNSASKRSAACTRALEALSANPNMKIDTLIQDVDALHSKPSWLEAVPCLVVKSEKKAYKDEAAIAWILDHHTKKSFTTYSRHKASGHKNTWL